MQTRGLALTTIFAAAIVAAACGSDAPLTGTAAVATVTVTGPTTAIFVGATTPLTVVTKDASGSVVSGATVTFTSSSDAIATVASTGVVTGVAPGTATITATSNGKTGTATVTVVSKIVNFTASMTPAGELGANLNGNPTGSGTFTATLDTTTNVFTWNATFTGLTSNVNNGHIHGPFPSGTTNSANVILNFNPSATPGATFTGLNSATSGSATGTVTLNAALVFNANVNGDSLKKLLLANAAYVNIHTVSNPAGEIRGQISKK
jgi:trimeric autotransporter adhesin